MEKQYLLRQFPPPPESPQPSRTPSRRFGFPDLAWPSLRLPFGETQKLAISLEGPDVRMVAVRGGRVLGWHETTLPSRLIRNGFLVAGQETGQHIREILNREGLPLKHLRVAIPGLQSVTRVLEIPVTVHANLDSLVERQTRHLLGGSLDNRYLFWHKLPTLPRSRLHNIYIVVMPREHLDTTLYSLTSAGLKVSSVDLKPLAVARAVNVRNGIIGHADLHGGDVVVVTDGIPTHIHSFYWSDEPLAVEYAHMRFVEHLTRTISSYNDAHRENPLNPNVSVYLTGPLADGEGLATTVAQITGRQIATPLTPLRYPPNLPLGTFMAPLGMTLKRE